MLFRSAYAGNNPVLFSDPDGRDYVICNLQGDCVTHPDSDLIHAKKVAPNLFVQYDKKGPYDSGVILNEDGSVLGTYRRVSVDPIYQLFEGKAEMFSSYFHPKLKAAGDLLPYFALPGGGGAVEGVLTQGGRIVEEVESAIAAVRAGANLEIGRAHV